MKAAMLEAFPDPLALAAMAASALQDGLRSALALRGRATLVATGGRAPGPVYDRLAQADLDWGHVIATLSDERCVPAEHPDSNLRLLRARLLTGQAAATRVLPLWPAPAPAELQALTPFDAVILGMGEDGHIASLIPGSPTLAAGLAPRGGPLTVLTPAGLGSPPVARISLTLTALLQSHAIFLLAVGDAKRDVIARALAGEDLPVRALLRQDHAPVRIMWSPDARD